MGKLNLNEFRLPRWNELPNLGLYLDQVQIVLDETLSPVTSEKSGTITGTMITNYVKQKVALPTEKKKYYRQHIAQLIMIFLLKHVLSTVEIQTVLQDMRDKELEEAYNGFCEEFERKLRLVSGREPQPGPCSELTSAAIDSLAGKLRFENILSEETEN